MERDPVLCLAGDEQVRQRMADALADAGLPTEPVATEEATLARLGDTAALVVASVDRSLLTTVSERRRSLPVVCFPADGSERLASDALAAGATDYLSRDGPDAYETLASRVVDATESTPADRFRALIEHSTDMITILGPEGEIEYVSPSIERILGYAPAELVGTNGFDYVHPDDREAVMGQFYDAIEDPDYDPVVEYRFEAADGEWRTIESRGKNRLDDPAVEGFVVNSRDVTERREREETLRTERALTEGILRTIPDTVYAFDPGGDPIREELILNEGLLGYSREELIEPHPLEFVPEEDQELLAGAIERILGGEGPESYESAIVAKNGERVPHEFNGARLTDDEGTVLGLVGTARDITERVEHERELARQNDRLEEFASVVSHDLRNPMNVIQGHVEMARREDSGDHLDVIESAVERMDAMVSDLLSLARQGRTIGDPEPLDIGAVAERAWESVETRDATLTVEDRCTIRGDGARLHELFANLFRNAVEHGDTGVTVRVGALDDGFYVADDGPGIPADEREAVLEHGYTTSRTGTGLGLAIVGRIAEAHGWDLVVTESESGGGERPDGSRASSDRRSGGARFEMTGVERLPGPPDDGSTTTQSTQP